MATTVELFDLKQRIAVDSLGTSDSRAIEKWLASKDLVMEGGNRSWSLQTSSGEKTNLAIRYKSDSDECINNALYLEHLYKVVGNHRVYHSLRDTEGVVEAAFAETAVKMSTVQVRGTVAHCRLYGVSEEEIIAALGDECANFAEFCDNA